MNQLKKFNKFLEKKLVNKYKMNVLGENDIYRYIGSYPGFIIILLAIIYIVALFYYYL
jgi:hypothetical protein